MWTAAPIHLLLLLLLLLGRKAKLRRYRGWHAKGQKCGERARLAVEGEHFGCGVKRGGRIGVMVRLVLQVLADLRLVLMQCLLVLL